MPHVSDQVNCVLQRGLQPPKVWSDPEAVKPNVCDDFRLSVIMIAWRKTEDWTGQQLMIGSDREEISLWNSHGLCEKRWALPCCLNTCCPQLQACSISLLGLLTACMLAVVLHATNDTSGGDSSLQEPQHVQGKSGRCLLGRCWETCSL